MSKINEYRFLENELEKLRKQTQLFETIFETAYEGIVVTDAHGYIQMINRTYADFLHVQANEVVGKHCTEIIPNTRMHIVAQTGEMELGQIQQINEGNMLVHRIPVKTDGQIVMVVGKVLFQNVKELHSLSSKIAQLQKELNFFKGELTPQYRAKYGVDNFIGDSPQVKNIKKWIRKISSSDTTILITGESGTGKELLAHAIHNHSYRKHGPFIKVNCAEIPESLVESVLFGYEEGAFTGALKGGKKGKFEIAQKGTIFLDEVGELPLSLQTKLLRVLQEKEIEPVGSLHPISIDTRIVAATHRNLEQMVKEGKFREDLYYRLHVLRLHVPPLRDRLEDLPLLVNHMLQELKRNLNVYVSEIESGFIDLLESYHWPGNIRELKNVLESTLHMMEDSTLRIENLPRYLIGSQRERKNSEIIRSLREEVEETERLVIHQALCKCNGNRTKASILLGLSRSSFYEKCKKYNLL